MANIICRGTVVNVHFLQEVIMQQLQLNAWLGGPIAWVVPRSDYYRHEEERQRYKIYRNSDKIEDHRRQEEIKEGFCKEQEECGRNHDQSGLSSS